MTNMLPEKARLERDLVDVLYEENKHKTSGKYWVVPFTKVKYVRESSETVASIFLGPTYRFPVVEFFTDDERVQQLSGYGYKPKDVIQENKEA